jgi:hypothetical protein
LDEASANCRAAGEAPPLSSALAEPPASLMSAKALAAVARAAAAAITWVVVCSGAPDPAWEEPAGPGMDVMFVWDAERRVGRGAPERSLAWCGREDEAFRQVHQANEIP